MSDSEIEGMKQIWALMLERGTLTNERFQWNYYLGNFVQGANHDWDYKKKEKLYEKFISEVKSDGVDWDKTTIPYYILQSEFADTFSEPLNVDTWVGTLVTKKDNKYHVGAIGLDLKPLIDSLKNGSLTAKYFN